jgi:L-ascorbate metabolism protein UlaG (beta-lactamase superfamily)
MKPRPVAVALAAGGVFALACGGTACWLLSAPSLEPYTALELTPAPHEPGEVVVRFFGTTTILIGDGETSILIDGFFSRPRLRQLLLGKIGPDERRIEAALERGAVSRLDAVLVAHSHHDHALDSAVVAHETGALLVGSESTANIGRGHGLAEERIRIVEDRDRLTFGRFEIEVIESPHSPGALNTGVIDEPLRPPVSAWAYKDGGNRSYLLRHDRGSILIQPSTNFAPGRLRDVRAAVVFLGIGVLGKQPDEFARDYWREVVQATGAGLVVPIHWDDFLRPLDEPLRPMPHLMDDFERGMRVLLRLAEADRVPVRFMPLYEPIDILRRAESPGSMAGRWSDAGSRSH